MTLPEDFVKLMQQCYGEEEASRLCTALSETEPEVSVRLNPHKCPLQSDDVATNLPLALDPVPWCRGAYYLKERPAFTFDPLLHAGVYYVQEASSMYLAKVVEDYALSSGTPQNVLDLCAAPGGKSTLLAGMLPEGSMLISNEPIGKRAQVLAENMTKWTRMMDGVYPVRTIVTNNYPVDFSRFLETFDLIVTDVPCSGEGMFRKDEGAIADWSMQKVAECQALQREIVETIWPCLRPGGLLVYSTCTFNNLEDEDNVRWIATTFGAEILEERHFLPGRDRGEGFFIAAIRKPLSDAAVRDEASMPLKNLKVMYDSVVVPEEMQGSVVELTYDEALQYLRREALRVEAPRGPVVLTYKGFVLGPGKGVGSRINNLLPQEWRIRTTYSNKFTLIP